MPEQRRGARPEHQRISGRQRKILRDAALAAARRLSGSAEALRRAASPPGAPDPDGLLAAAGALYTYAVEEYGKALLLGSLPEKGGIVSVPYREIFRSHRKKLDAALADLPLECRMLRRGIFDPDIFDPDIFDVGLQAGFSGRTSLLYLDMGRNGDPIERSAPDAEMLEDALCSLGQAVARKERRLAAGTGGAARRGLEAASDDKRQGRARQGHLRRREPSRRQRDSPPTNPRQAPPRGILHRSDRA